MFLLSRYSKMSVTVISVGADKNCQSFQHLLFGKINKSFAICKGIQKKAFMNIMNALFR